MPPADAPSRLDGDAILKLQRIFGYTIEELRMITTPMAEGAYEAIGSMGNDASLAVLSDQNHLLFNYFKQLFAQVTNPPLDAIREELVTSSQSFIGSQQNLFTETPNHCRQLKLESPIITNEELARIRNSNVAGLRTKTLKTLFKSHSGPGSLKQALLSLCEQVSEAVKEGLSLIHI